MGTDVTDMKRVYKTSVDNEFSADFSLNLIKETSLRYGENPNQSAAIYKFKGTSLADLTNIKLVKSGKGGLSATNYMDITNALDILKFFDKPAVSVMKHTIPSGFATEVSNQNLATLYRSARDADTRSAFGSVVVFNRPIGKDVAHALLEGYVEGVAAPSFEEGTVELLSQKKNLRLVTFANLEKIPKYIGDDLQGLYNLRVLPTARVVVQKPYLTSIKNADDLIFDPLVRRKGVGYEVLQKPSNREKYDLLISWYVNLGVRSNGIVLVKDGVTLAVGSGQQERVGAIEQAIVKGYQKAMDRAGIEYSALLGISECKLEPLKGAVCSSDAFFPFRDSIDLLAKVGVSAIIQPGGALRDYDVINAVNEHKMAMAFTLERCFGHF